MLFSTLLLPMFEHSTAHEGRSNVIAKMSFQASAIADFAVSGSEPVLRLDDDI